MHHLSLRGRFLFALLGLFLAAGTGQVKAQAVAPAVAPSNAEPAVIAVFDLQGIRTEPTTTAAASDRLRDELHKTGHFKLLSRNALDKKLSAGRLTQASCMEADCALKVGKALGARLVLTGRIIIIDSGAWQVSAEIGDVTTGDTIVAGSNIYEGNIVGLMTKGIPQLVHKLIPAGDSASYADIADFLQQRKSSPPIAENSTASRPAEGGHEARKPRKPPPQRLRMPFKLQRYRAWASPYSTFDFRFGEVNTGTLERFTGSGYALGFEAQTNKYVGAGATVHFGSLETINSPVSGRAEEPMSGDYQTIGLLGMAGLPRENSWFYVGGGLGYTTVNWNDGGVSGTDTLLSVLMMARFAYTFDWGLMLGINYQTGDVGHASGDRYDSLRNQGIEHPKVETAATSLLLGYAF